MQKLLQSRYRDSFIFEDGKRSNGISYFVHMVEINFM